MLESAQEQIAALDNRTAIMERTKASISDGWHGVTISSFFWSSLVTSLSSSENPCAVFPVCSWVLDFLYSGGEGRYLEDGH
mgnify:FL=1